MKPRDFISLVICLAVSAICGAALWSREIPKTFPEQAYYQKNAAEEWLRNADANDPMRPLIQQALTRINRYIAVAGQKIGGPDGNKDGIVDDLDVEMVAKAKGADGRKWMILPKTSTKVLDHNDPNIVWQEAVYK